MISRRQIIGHHQEQTPLKQQLAHSNGTSSQQSSSSSTSTGRARAACQPLTMIKQQQQVARKTIMNNNHNNQQQDSSDGYVMNSYAEFAANGEQRSWQQQQQAPADDYRHFDPYSIYSDEEDVWYSEERLFEDHLEEIFNKWRLLDDDIWCKLIIMERNRRIGKAYARVPIVTIDGSHELSYDGYKLALNGFDNPDRDLKTEECRKRIGKGIRIKMDNFGNILIKRLSKSGVFIKEWIQGPASLPPLPAGQLPPMDTSAVAVAAAAAATKAQTGGNIGRVMPSRQQLIKNQNAAMLNGSSGSSTNSSLGSQSTTNSMDQQPNSGTSMMTTNDSAICDEVLSVGGRLDQDKIYVLFDMKKFQANITQELCRPYPDKRKLEQQCFSIVGLTRDSDDILNLPCWVMVINIVAIEVLNERFPDLMLPGGSSSSSGHNQVASGGGGGYATGGGPRSQRQPNFVSIFDRAKERPSKEEDPYSLPANESSSDVKSSIHGDYATNGALGRSRYYGPGGPSKSRADMYKRGMAGQQQHLLDHAPPMRHKSRSNSNIYGVGIGNKLQPLHQQLRGAHLASNSSRYNNSSSIYSPGHMLVLPPNDSVPPELPPRDFVSKKVTKSKSSTALSDEVYSISQLADSSNTKVRKTKRNRFLESLKAPLELAKSSSSRSSASVLGSSSVQSSSSLQTGKNRPEKTTAVATRATGNKSSKSSNIVKSLLGVKGSQSKLKQQKDISGDDAKKLQADQKSQRLIDSAEADSVVDSAEELADEPLSNHQTCSSTSSSYNDLDIPTPDYETDENIYALNETASYAAFSSIAGGGGGGKNSDNKERKSSTTKKNLAGSQSALGGSKQQQQQQQKNGKQNNSSKKAHNKDDLYYSGFRAHVPSNINGLQQQQQPQQQQHQAAQVSRSVGGNSAKAASLMDGPSGEAGRLMKARNSRYASHLANQHQQVANKMSGRDMMIYGSTTGLSAASSAAAGAGGGPAGSRYRSASMQRYSSRGQQRLHQQHHQSMYSDYYDPGPAEDPYGGSHYGVALQGRRRSNGKCLPGNSSLYGVTCQTSRANQAAAANSPPYDIGRSSSGIYGNNSNSSSSSDYADWHPQMRKVNSSGYLNSIFKGHHNHHLHQSPVESPYGSNAHNGSGADQANVVVPPHKTKPAAHGYSNNNNSNHNGPATTDGQGFVGSRTLAPRSASVLSKQQLQQQSQQQQQQQVLPNGGPAYRSYDSSNDSEPSYTNSSDGLDIYDHIGAVAAQTTTTRLANNGKLHHSNNNNNNHLHHRQFLDMQPIHTSVAHNHLAPEVHVGEWENMYDR